MKGTNPKKGGALQGRNPCQTCEELASESGSLVHVFAVLFLLSDLHNKILLQTGFPDGGFSRVMLTKSLCVHLSCLLSFLVVGC